MDKEVVHKNKWWNSSWFYIVLFLFAIPVSTVFALIIFGTILALTLSMLFCPPWANTWEPATCGGKTYPGQVVVRPTPIIPQGYYFSVLNSKQQIVEQRNYGFSFTFPTELKVQSQQQQDGDEYLYFYKHDETKEYKQIIQFKTSINPYAVNHRTNSFYKSYDLHGIPAWRNGDEYSTYVEFERDGRGYELAFMPYGKTSSKQEYAHYQQIYEDMLKSFTFNKQ